jgi:uncharacterized membrane protein (DUF441 family)
VASLVELRGLRTAPDLDGDQRIQLMLELEQCLAGCDWFTIGIMAPSADGAMNALRATEARLQWSALEASAAPESTAPLGAGPVFLKGNQSTGQFSLRQEDGLGVGILITGHAPANPDAEDTWGPLPLDFFS